MAEIRKDSRQRDVLCDSDWALDGRERKCWSGGIIFLSGIPIFFWSKTQSNIALSSGKAELNGSVKATSEVLGRQQFWKELVHEVLKTRIYVDAVACEGTMPRAGAGRFELLSTYQLWVQSVLGELVIAV